MSHFSLFSGIGGIDLAAEWAGFRTVGQCEIADYPYKVLCKHWPDVPKWRDIKDVTEQSVRDSGIRAVDLISGGFPCQPYSIAGDRKGEEDDRHLWPEMLRVISQLHPTWVLGENVAHFVQMELDKVLSDLEGIGYTGQTFVIPACAVNAPHRRDRAFIVAYSNGIGHKRTEQLPENTRPAEKRTKGIHGTITKLFDDIDWKARAIQSCFLGESHGVPRRLDRIRCLGNAVMPLQVYPILKAIYDIESNIYKG